MDQGEKQNPLEQVQEWSDNLSQVEAKLDRFEREILSQESTLAAMLNDCDSLLNRLNEVPNPRIADGGDVVNETDEEDGSQCQYLEKLKLEALALQERVVEGKCTCQPSSCASDTPCCRLRLKSKGEKSGCCSNFQSCQDCGPVKMAAGESPTVSVHFFEGNYLCEYCGELLTSARSIQEHKKSCNYSP